SRSHPTGDRSGGSGPPRSGPVPPATWDPSGSRPQSYPYSMPQAGRLGSSDAWILDVPSGAVADSNHDLEARARGGIRPVYFQSGLITRIKIMPLASETARHTPA